MVDLADLDFLLTPEQSRASDDRWRIKSLERALQDVWELFKFYQEYAEHLEDKLGTIAAIASGEDPPMERVPVPIVLANRTLPDAVRTIIKAHFPHGPPAGMKTHILKSIIGHELLEHGFKPTKEALAKAIQRTMNKLDSRE